MSVGVYLQLLRNWRDATLCLKTNDLYIRMELSLGSDPGVRVFAPQYPTRKGMIIHVRQLSDVVLANLKDNIDLFEAVLII